MGGPWWRGKFELLVRAPQGRAWRPGCFLVQLEVGRFWWSHSHIGRHLKCYVQIRGSLANDSTLISLPLTFRQFCKDGCQKPRRLNKTRDCLWFDQFLCLKEFTPNMTQKPGTPKVVFALCQTVPIFKAAAKTSGVFSWCVSLGIAIDLLPCWCCTMLQICKYPGSLIKRCLLAFSSHQGCSMCSDGRKNPCFVVQI